jgi:hypothetical protein
MPGIGAGAGSGSAAGAGGVAFGIERRGADRFLAFFFAAFLAIFFAAGLRAAARFLAAFLFLRAGAARFACFALVFDFFRFFAMIVLRSLRLNFQYGWPACIRRNTQLQHECCYSDTLQGSCPFVLLRVPPRQYAP